MLKRTRGLGADGSDDALQLDLLRLELASGSPPSTLDRLPVRARRAIGIAAEVGAPLLPAMDSARAAEDDRRRAARAVLVASAQAKAVALGLLGAPLVLVPGLGAIVGVDLLAFYTTSFGLAVLVAAISLLGLGAGSIALLVARVGKARQRPTDPHGPTTALAVLGASVAWASVGVFAAPLTFVVIRRLVRGRAPAPPPRDVDEVVDLVATALDGGVSAPAALRLVAERLEDHAPDLRQLAHGLELGVGSPPAASGVRVTSFERLEQLLRAAERAGVAIAPTLRRLAAELRADDLAQVLAAAERLPAQLTFPTALCLLPATVALVGAPIVHAGLLGAGLS